MVTRFAPRETRYRSCLTFVGTIRFRLDRQRKIKRSMASLSDNLAIDSKSTETMLITGIVFGFISASSSRRERPLRLPRPCLAEGDEGFENLLHVGGFRAEEVLGE